MLCVAPVLWALYLVLAWSRTPPLLALLSFPNAEHVVSRAT